MNFADFSFWYVWFWLMLILAGARLALGHWRAWPDFGDRLGLMAISLALFYNAAPGSFAIFCVSITLNYLVVQTVLRGHGAWRLLLTTAMVFLNFSLLAYFKYIDFYFGEFLASAVAAAGGGMPEFTSDGIPPGISFYTFQMTAFLIDTYRAPTARPPRFVDYVNFTAFFPQLVAGPIERRAGLLPQVEAFRFRYDPQGVEAGFRYAALGFFMKMVLADNIAAYVDRANTVDPFLILGSAYLFGLRIFFDFAGYSFIALGLGRALGVRLTVNFRFPYTATNIREFWQRWHVTLSNWFRDYLYFPLGGTKVPWVAANLLLVFAVSGLWHGAGWNFIAWGLYHGLLLVAYRYLGSRIDIGRAPAWVLTYAAAMFGWLFFMETNGATLAYRLERVFDPGSYSLDGLAHAMRAQGAASAGVLLVTLALAHAELLREFFAARKWVGNEDYLPSVPTAFGMAGASFLMTAREQSPFVYFAF